MKEIREIFETVRTYCGMMFGDAKRPRGEEDKSVTEKMYCHASMPLGIFASKSVSHKVNVGEVGTPPYGATHVALSDKSRKSAFTLDESFTHVAHCDKFRRAAFTLAEVLITLGIIGVVAALTLPTLIQNHQKQVYVTQLKKAYSTINNAYNKMAADEGVVDWTQTYCYYSFSWDDGEQVRVERKKECFDRLTKQMNVIKKKELGVACSEPWCQYNSTDEHFFDYIFVNTDGITYMFSCALQILRIDVNGTQKGPNQDGRDIFELIVIYGENKIIPNGSEHDEWKNCSARRLSTACTAKVLMEGKMNY